MERRVRLQDIATGSGVHFSTVSRALRNDPCLPRATVERIQALAQKMGYQADPNAKAMAVYRRAIRPSSVRNTLALLVPPMTHLETLEGILGRVRPLAENQGYRIELLHTHVPTMSPTRLTRILKSRGTAGLLVLPDGFETKQLRRLKLDWSLFPAVTLGHGLFWPSLHRVSDNHFRNAKQLVRRMVGLGYRRIGFCVEASMAAMHADGGWRGGYLVEMERLGEPPRPFYVKGETLDFTAIRTWIKRERLDAVIVDGNNMVANFFGSDLKVPERLGVAGLIVTNPLFSGMDPDYDRVWRTALDFLIYLIHTNQRGIPESPQRIMLEGNWVPGTTLRRMNSPLSLLPDLD